DRPAARGLGSDVPDHQTVRGAREAAVGDERYLVAEPLADERRGDVQHLAHPRAARRALVADHDDLARLDGARLDRGEAVLLGVEHACRAAMEEAFVPRELHDRALGSQVAAEHREPAGRLERPLEGYDDLLPRRLDYRGRDVRERPPVDVR